MNKLEQQVAIRLLLLIGRKIKKASVSTWINDKFGEGEDYEREEFENNFFANVIAFIEKDCRQREGSKLDIGSGQSQEWRYFGTYLVDLYDETNNTLEHSFWVAFSKYGKISTGCQSCGFECTAFEGV